MRNHVVVLTMIAGAAIFFACSKSSGNNSGGGSGNATATTGGSTAGGSTNSAITANSWPSGFWLGFDGSTTFSMLLSGGHGGATYTINDPTIASISPTSFNIDQTTHDNLWADCTKINPNANKQLFESRYAVGTTINAFKMTALAPGSTTITRNVKAGSQTYNPTSGTNLLTVTQYPSTAVAAGNARYNNQPSVPTATNVPCGPTCHGDAAHGAPSHALGQVESIPDVAVAQWITTGSLPFIKLNAQTDKGVAHNWTFTDSAEETGIIAYLRTLQASNFEELLTLEFESDTSSAKICSLTAPPGVGTGGGSTGN